MGREELSPCAGAQDQPCVFWIGLPGGTGRCGIYPVRPHVCQTYPAVLREGESVRREDVLCPKAAWRDGTLRQPAWLRHLHEMHVEHDIYRLVAARWNHHVMHTARPDLVSLTGYYGYVLQCYERLAPVRERIEPAEWAALCESWAASLLRGRSPLVDEVPELASWAWLFHDVVAAATSVVASSPRTEAASIP